MEKEKKPNHAQHIAHTPRGDKDRPAGDISDEIYELTFANIFSHVNNEIAVVLRGVCGNGGGNLGANTRLSRLVVMVYACVWVYIYIYVYIYILYYIHITVCIYIDVVLTDAAAVVAPPLPVTPSVDCARKNSSE